MTMRNEWITRLLITCVLPSSACFAGCDSEEAKAARRISKLQGEYTSQRSDWPILRSTFTEEELGAWNTRHESGTTVKSPTGVPTMNLIDAGIFRRMEDAENKMSRITKELKALGMTDADLKTLRESVVVDDVH